MRVCYFGTYRQEYSRNQIMIESLRRAGVDVIECNQQLWSGIEDRVQAVRGRWLHPSFWGRLLSTYSRLLRNYRQVGSYDVLMIGYPGQLDVFLGRLLSWLRRKPLVWDFFMSIYLISQERGLDKQNPRAVRALFWLEKMGLILPDLLIQDTAEYVDWIQHTYGLSSTDFCLVPTGADDRVFFPQPVPSQEKGHFLVTYYGTLIPNHGVPIMVEAAHLLSDQPDIHFELIGDGPDREKAQALAQKYDLKNITFIEWLDKEALVQRVAQADACLGAVGVTPQSLMTIQNKIYEALAMGKAVITGDSLTMRNTFVHGEHLYLCERENPRSLADAILSLREHPELREKIARQGYNHYKEHFSFDQIGARLKQCLVERIR